MYTPLASCEEYQEPKPQLTLVIPAKLEPVDYRILTYLFQGIKTAKIASRLGRSLAEIARRIDRTAFRQAQAEVEAGVVKSILQASAAEPTTMAKAAAPGAMRQVVKLSSTCQDPRTRLQASKTVLTYAGIEPPRRIEVTTPERILDQMTADELARFAAHRIWPERFRELLRAFLPAPGQPPASETIIEATATPHVEEPEADESEVGADTAYDGDDDPK
jgi:hypothetical protein